MSSSEAQSAKPAKPLVLRVAEVSPATGTRAVFLQKACSEVEKLTEGRIKMEIYWSESLIKTREFPKAIQRGICDMAYVASPYHPAEIPLWTHLLTVLYHPKGEDAVWINMKAWELLDNSKPLRADFEKLGQTAWFMFPYDSYPLYSHKIVKKLEDMKGMRIRVSGEGYSKMVSAIGGHPTFIVGSEVYSALERKTVDGALAGWEWGKRFRFFEVAPYAVDMSVFVLYATTNVSLAALGRMSEKDKKTFFEVGRRVSIEYGKAVKKEREDYKAFMKETGTKILPFPNEEREKWAEMPEVKALIKQWIEEQNAAGRPGTEVMRTFLRIFEVPQWMPAGY